MAFHHLCIFQYTAAVMFVFIVLFMIVLIPLTAVLPQNVFVPLWNLSQCGHTGTALFPCIMLICEGFFVFVFYSHNGQERGEVF